MKRFVKWLDRSLNNYEAQKSLNVDSMVLCQQSLIWFITQQKIWLDDENLSLRTLVLIIDNQLYFQIIMSLDYQNCLQNIQTVDFRRIECMTAIKIFTIRLFFKDRQIIQDYYDLVLIILFFQLMSINPFIKTSPILHLYQKSRSKSESNFMPIKSRAKSFREFQVKMITNALNQKHIIQKQYQGQKNREIRRQKQFSKYYGLQSFRMNAPEHQSVSKKPAQHVDNKLSSHRTSDKISTLINIKPQTAYCINSQRYMSYESNYQINNMQYRPSEYMVGSQNSLSKSNSMRSSSRRISFFSEAQNNPYQQQESRSKRSRFMEDKKYKVDKIKEQVHEDYMLTKKSCKNVGNHKRYA